MSKTGLFAKTVNYFRKKTKVDYSFKLSIFDGNANAERTWATKHLLQNELVLLRKQMKFNTKELHSLKKVFKVK